MTTHSYTDSELVAAGVLASTLFRRALAHGYTNPSVNGVDDNTDVTIDESDDKTTTMDNLAAAVVPVISLDSYAVEIVGDGSAVGSVTLTDSRGAGASGKAILLTFDGPGGLSIPGGSSYTINGSGQATINFGASPSADWCSALVTLSLSYVSGEASPLSMTVEYTD